MKLLIDMNLSPELSPILARHGWQTQHWASVGEPRATDAEIMEYARTNGFTVITHDLDFGSLLAVTNASGPSVVQLRLQDVSPTNLETILVPALHQFQTELESGALIVIDAARLRARVLPLVR